MPSLRCSVPGCDYATDNLGEVAAAALLNNHSHSHSPNMLPPAQIEKLLSLRAYLNTALFSVSNMENTTQNEGTGKSTENLPLHCNAGIVNISSGGIATGTQILPNNSRYVQHGNITLSKHDMLQNGENLENLANNGDERQEIINCHATMGKSREDDIVKYRELKRNETLEEENLVNQITEEAKKTNSSNMNKNTQFEYPGEEGCQEYLNRQVAIGKSQDQAKVEYAELKRNEEEMIMKEMQEEEAKIEYSSNSNPSVGNVSAEFRTVLCKDSDGKEYIRVPIVTRESPLIGCVALKNSGLNDKCTSITILKIDETENPKTVYEGIQYYRVPIIENDHSGDVSELKNQSNGTISYKDGNGKEYIMVPIEISLIPLKGFVAVKNDEDKNPTYLKTDSVSENPVCFYEGKQYYQLPVVEDDVTGDVYKLIEQSNDHVSVLLNEEQIAVESSNGLQQSEIHMNDPNLETIVSPGKMPVMNENINDESSSNDNSHSESSRNATLKPIGSRKRKNPPLYAEPEPLDPETNKRWKQACTTERNRRKKNENNEKRDKELNKYKEMYAESQEKLAECQCQNKMSEMKLNFYKKIIAESQEKLAECQCQKKISEREEMKKLD